MLLSRKTIEELVTKIEKFLRECELLEDVCIYFNNKRRLWRFDCKTGEYIVKEEEDMNPLDYFSYAARNHILSMSFEGGLYSVLNGYTNSHTIEAKFEDLFRKYDLRYELGNAWNLTVYPIDGKYDEIEYTAYEKEPEPKFIHMNSKDVPAELKNIMLAWYELSKKVGDKGSCVIGAGYYFKYFGCPYFMSACSPYQGSLSWESCLEPVKNMLINIGATDIRYDYGRLD